jgi:hypothetical protein
MGMSTMSRRAVSIALLDGSGDLFGLAVADADLAGTVTDYHQGGEAEATATLDHLGTRLIWITRSSNWLCSEPGRCCRAIG